jgi:hypothetical protein
MVTTSVPGHRRPTRTKQLKCQIAAIRNGKAENCSRHSAAGYWIQCAAKARGGGLLAADRRPNYRLKRACYCSTPQTLSSLRLKPRHHRTALVKKSGRLRNPGADCRVSDRAFAPANAKPGMPTIYTADDLILITLHERSAATI